MLEGRASLPVLKLALYDVTVNVPILAAVRLVWQAGIRCRSQLWYVSRKRNFQATRETRSLSDPLQMEINEGSFSHTSSLYSLVTRRWYVFLSLTASDWLKIANKCHLQRDETKWSSIFDQTENLRMTFEMISEALRNNR